MTEQPEGPDQILPEVFPNQTEPNRLTTAEFLMQLDAAETWMLWINPKFEEIELIVKDSDDAMTAFHGPDPMSMDFQAYKKFCAEVERVSNRKDTGHG